MTSLEVMAVLSLLSARRQDLAALLAFNRFHAWCELLTVT